MKQRKAAKDGSNKNGGVLFAKGGTYKLQETCAEALVAMSEGARADGYNLYLKSAYRSYQTQKTMYTNRLKKNKGKDDGWVSQPGSSDHQTGLGCDVVPKSWRDKAMNGKMGKEPECIWMAEHCQEYGFILRYPSDKEEITEINYEPWHMRYVGIPAATYIMENGLCLEEFTEQLQEAIREYLDNGGEGKNMKLLIVDDEARIRALISKYAAFEGYETEEAENGMQAIEMCRQHHYDLVIMDVMMPELDGFSAVREIRKNDPVPVIMLSARGEEYDRIHGFELGIDDYVVKPFSPKELMMRVGAVIRRSGEAEKKAEETVSVGGLTVDFTARRVIVDGVEAELSPKEYDLLFYMIRNRGIALTREKLISDVWGYDFFGDDRTLDTHIKLLRKQLGPYADKITTLRGVGYRFEKE